MTSEAPRASVQDYKSARRTASEGLLEPAMGIEPCLPQAGHVRREWGATAISSAAETPRNRKICRPKHGWATTRLRLEAGCDCGGIPDEFSRYGRLCTRRSLSQAHNSLIAFCRSTLEARLDTTQWFTDLLLVSSDPPSNPCCSRDFTRILKITRLLACRSSLPLLRTGSALPRPVADTS